MAGAAAATAGPPGGSAPLQMLNVELPEFAVLGDYCPIECCGECCTALTDRQRPPVSGRPVWQRRVEGPAI
eukprot:SAG22_NODE_2211_length_2832_cov_2.111965_1_plen_71_part_00